MSGAAPGDPRVLPLLAEAIRGPDPEARKEVLAGLALAGVSAAPAVPALAGRLKDGPDDEVGDLLRCLQALGPAALQAAPELAQFFRRVPTMRSYVLQVLNAAGAGGGEILPLLTEWLDAETSAGFLDDPFVSSVKRLGTEARPLLPALLAFARRVEPDPDVRELYYGDVVRDIDPAAAARLLEP